MKLLVSGGGTGGHIFPALAIADAVKQLAPETEVLFVGAEGRMEMQRVPKAGYPIKGLWISGFQRRLTWQNILFPIKVFWSMRQANAIVRQFKPDVVVGTGGYASGPTLKVAQRKGIPTVIQEQNSYAGVTNKLLSKKASKICVAWPGMDRFFPAEKIVITGNPVRRDLLQIAFLRQQAAQFYGLDPLKPTLFITGGSLGARTLNQAVDHATALLQSRTELQVIWQIGKSGWETFSHLPVAHLPNVKALDFVERMDYAYALADVVICRAGALTLAELTLAGKAAVLVPSPNVAEDHQTKNAKALADPGAAILVPDAEAVHKAMAEALRILDTPELKSSLEILIKKFAKPDAAMDIAREVLALRHQ